jgi:transposase
MDRSSEFLIKELPEKVKKLTKLLEAALDANKLLKAENEALKARLNLDSHNSSRPPSSDSVYKKKSRNVRKKKAASKRSKGGQPGHQGHHMEMLEPSRVVPIHPDSCKCGGRKFAHPQPYHTHRVVELPDIPLEVVHYELNKAVCRRCGNTVKAGLPHSLKTGYGPRLTAFVGELSGPMRLSRNQVKRLFASVFDFKVCTGAIQKMVDRVSSAIFPHWRRMGEAARSRSVNYIDETSWNNGGSLDWLWTMSGEKSAFLMIHPHRNMEAFDELIGEWKGLLVSDGYGVYQHWPHGRQTCLAHLHRKAKGFSESDNREIEAAGMEAIKLLGTLFKWSHTPPTDRKIEVWTAKCHRFIQGNRLRKDALGAFSRSIEKHLFNLVTFLCADGVEPTNNRAERSLRFAVIWRKLQMGTDSAKGEHWVERVVSLIGTCRNMGISTYPILKQAVSSLFNQTEPSVAWIPIG